MFSAYGILTFIRVGIIVGGIFVAVLWALNRYGNRAD